MRILFPHGEGERIAAIQEAAFKPALFAEMKEKWPDRPPSDESLRSFLVRKGFSQGALDQVIQFYRETLDIAKIGNAAHDSPQPSRQREEVLQHHQSAPQPTPPQAVLAAPVSERPFTVAFDGAVITGMMALRTVKDIDRLVKVLEAQKAAIAAMQDDDDGPRDHDLMYESWNEERLIRQHEAEE